MNEIINQPPTSVRTLDEMRTLLMDRQWGDNAINRDLYYVWRNALPTLIEKQESEKEGLRYDLTKISSFLLGREFNKTMGHEHNSAELYEIVEGSGYFLFQDFYNGAVHEFFAVSANQGDKIYIEPAHGHLIINTGGKDLITANIAVRHRAHDYSLFENKHGACYYAISDDNGAVQWVANENYGPVPPIKIIKAQDTFASIGIDIKQNSLYDLLTKEPHKLYFLK